MEVTPMARSQAGKNGWATIQMFGMPYSIPITKEMKRLFGMYRRGDDWKFKDQATENDFERVMRDTIAAVYHQVREIIGQEVGSELARQLETKMSEMFAPSARKAIEEKFAEKEQKLLPSGDTNGAV